MFHILGRIPDNFYLACSGGSDSIIFADFLLKFPKRKFEVIHFNHGTEYCDEAELFVKTFCEKNNLIFHTEKIKDPNIPSSVSREDFWRKARYSFFEKFKDKPIITCHHLNDCIETWVMTSLAGKPSLIPYKNNRYGILRPFLVVPKSEINSWAIRHSIKYVTDSSNFDTSINRNYIRHVMMPHILRINPGIETTIRHIIEKDFKANS